jgi:hypothetical protein
MHTTESHNVSGTTCLTCLAILHRARQHNRSCACSTTRWQASAHSSQLRASIRLFRPRQVQTGPVNSHTSCIVASVAASAKASANTCSRLTSPSQHPVSQSMPRYVQLHRCLSRVALCTRTMYTPAVCREAPSCPINYMPQQTGCPAPSLPRRLPTPHLSGGPHLLVSRSAMMFRWWGPRPWPGSAALLPSQPSAAWGSVSSTTSSTTLLYQGRDPNLAGGRGRACRKQGVMCQG